jgi:hypothetical protein
LRNASFCDRAELETAIARLVPRRETAENPAFHAKNRLERRGAAVQSCAEA